MYQILFLDIDGTLRDEHFGIPKTAAVAIQRCRERGCKVILCTGRTKSCITDDVLALPVDGIIAGGGCHIEFQGKIIKNTFFPRSQALKALNYLSSLTLSTPIAVENDTGVYMNERAAKVLLGQNKKKLPTSADSEVKFLKKSPEKIQYLDSLDEFFREASPLCNPHISKICLWSPASVFKELAEILTENCFCLAQQETNPEYGGYYELIQKNGDKGHGIRKLCSYLGVRPEHTIAFGDSGNDIAMFKAVGCGIAMRNGCDSLKEIADGVCEPLLENGLFMELKRRNLLLKMEA